MTMKNKEEIKRYISGVMEVKRTEEGEESRVIRGQAVVFDQPTELYNDGEFCLRETISREAVTKELLDKCDIKMTIDHNLSRMIARSKRGKGSLSYTVTEEGVFFEFEAPATPDGDTALEGVKRGDIDGCSFFAYAYDEDMEIKRSKVGDCLVVDRIVRRFDEFLDFCITPDPAYPQTSVSAAVKRSRLPEKPKDPDSWANLEKIINS